MAKTISQADHSRLDLSKEIPLKTPMVIYIEPSGYCNLRCNFCPQTTGKMQKGMMGLDLWKEAINQAKEFKESIKMLRVCGNGEPTMNHFLFDMLKYAHKSKIFEKIEIVTNGTLLNDILIQNMSNYCTRIIISIEGLSTEEYEIMTGKRIDFDFLVENIKKLYKNKNCKLMIKTIDKQVSTTYKREKFYRIFNKICDEIYIENLVPMWPDLQVNDNIKSRWEDSSVTERLVCVQIFKGFQIQSNGDVVACCVDWERKNLLGNITVEKLKDIWNGEKLERLQMKHLRGIKKTFTPCCLCVMNDTCDPDNIDSKRIEILRRIIDERI
jgi:radical SAM protein with 4Fe4S-binding SPASM domain